MSEPVDEKDIQRGDISKSQVTSPRPEDAEQPSSTAPDSGEQNEAASEAPFPDDTLNETAQPSGEKNEVVPEAPSSDDTLNKASQTSGEKNEVVSEATSSDDTLNETARPSGEKNEVVPEAPSPDDTLNEAAPEAPSPDSTLNETTQPSEPKRLHGTRLVLVEFCLCMGLLLSIVDASIVSTALVTIGRYFNDFAETYWIVLAYLLTYMTFCVVWARFSDVVGHKWAVVAAWIVFVAFSLGCGLAQSMNQLIIFRTLQGIGGSGLYSMTILIIPSITPKEHFATMSGATGAVFAVSSVLGPVLGGVICNQTTWRWIFLLNVPVGVATILLILLAWPTFVANRALSLHKSSLAQLDVIGLVLLTAATVLLIVGLQQAGSAIIAWGSSITIGLLTASGVSAIGLVAWTGFLESRGDRTQITPTFPLAFLKRRILLGNIIITLLTGFHLFLVIVQLPEHFQIVNGASAISSGIRLMPLLFASALGSTVASWASSKRNNTFVTLMMASSFLLVGSGLLSTTSTDFHLNSAIYGYQVIFGLGIGMTFSTSVIVTTVEAPLQYYALALGVVNQARILGGTIGLAVSTIIFNIRVGTDLKGILSPSEITALRRTLNSIPYFSVAQQAAISYAFALSFNEQMRVCMYIAAVCWVVSASTWSAKATPLLKRKEIHDAAIEDPNSEEVREAMKEELGR